MHISLQHKKALVGGSTSGIGRAIAWQLAASGATVTLMARNEASLQTLAAELPAPYAQKHDWLVVDFADFAHYQQVINFYFAENTIDILVNNTQGPPAGSALDKNPTDYQAAFDLLFQTHCHTTLAALPHMQKSGWGRIINVSSVSVREPLPHLALSNSIRTALASWAKTLATAVAADGITVNTVLTGYFDTSRLESLMKSQAAQKGISLEAMREEFKAQIPANRLGDPAEYGQLVTFLASEQAAYLTGASIPLDGGLLKGF